MRLVAGRYNSHQLASEGKLCRLPVSKFMMPSAVNRFMNLEKNWQEYDTAQVELGFTFAGRLGERYAASLREIKTSIGEAIKYQRLTGDCRPTVSHSFVGR